MKKYALMLIILATANQIAIAQKQAMIDTSKSKPIVYSYVEQMPEFIGGQAALQKFLTDNIQYPAKAKEQSMEGRVYVQFIVNQDGSLSDIKVVRSPDALLSDEAIRVLKQMPKWKPGKQNGQPVNVYMTLPVSFSIH